jgi:HSP20 family molecular chaperone IbpA
LLKQEKTMLNKHHASSERLREVFYGKASLLETAVEKISDCRGEIVEKIGFVPVYVVQQKTERFIPRFDLFEAEENFHIDIELPGLAANEIKVTVTGEWIRVTGKRSKRTDSGKTLFLEQLDGHFSRTLHLDSPIDGVNCKAVLNRGLLRIKLPKVVSEIIEADEFSVSIQEE